MIGLTRRQFQCLDFIVKYQERYDIPPTMFEISQGLGLKSKTSAVDFVTVLVERGYIKRLTGKTRGIRVLHKATNSDLIKAARILATVAKETHPKESANVMRELWWIDERKERKRPKDQWQDD